MRLTKKFLAATDVKSDPGPAGQWRPASRIAEITSSGGAAAGGSKKMCLTGRFASEMFVSPSTIVPSSSSPAQSLDDA